MALVHSLLRRQDPPPPQFDFTPFVESQVTTQRVTLALITWMFYDLVLTPQATLDMFVARKVTFPKVLFVLNRYVSPWMMVLHAVSLMHPNPSATFCRASPWILLLGNSLVIFCISAALIARVHALWQDRRILFGVLATFGIISLSNFLFIAIETGKSPGFPTPFPAPFTGCIWIPKNDKLWVTFLTSGLFETTCVALTVWKTWKAVDLTETPTLYILFHDGVAYYLCIIATKILTVVSGLFPQTFWFGGSNAILAISSMLCSWIYIRLHSVLREQSKFSVNSPRVMRLLNSPYSASLRFGSSSSGTTLKRAGSISSEGTARTKQSGYSSSSSGQRSISTEGTIEYYWAWEKPLPPLPAKWKLIFHGASVSKPG